MSVRMWLCVTLFFPGSPLKADTIAEAVKVLQTVEPAGGGSAAAREAVEALSTVGEPALIPILEGFQLAGGVGANWLRNAFDETVSRHLAAGKQLPAEALLQFVRNQKQSPVARRLAYEALLRQDSGLSDRLIPGMLLDPSSEFRRDAVARLISEAGKLDDKTKSTPLYQKALTGAVHEDQVKTISEALRKNGEKVDIQKHFGFVGQWMIAGPFDNKDEKGFAVDYAPEQEVSTPAGVNLKAEYDGQLGKVKWQPIGTEDDFGLIDIAKQIQNYKGSAMYAAASVESGRDQQLEIRLGTPNAWKLWVNGTLMFEREEYHRNSKMDQYRVPVTLSAGKNRILLKVCQNEQTQEWAQDYKFQLRLCDATGSSVPEITTVAAESSGKGVVR